jgi:hypothetical protein
MAVYGARPLSAHRDPLQPDSEERVGIAGFACGVDHFVELELPIAEVSADEIPVGLLAQQVQFDEID